MVSKAGIRVLPKKNFNFRASETHQCFRNQNFPMSSRLLLMISEGRSQNTKTSKSFNNRLKSSENTKNTLARRTWTGFQRNKEGLAITRKSKPWLLVPSYDYFNRRFGNTRRHRFRTRTKVWWKYPDYSSGILLGSFPMYYPGRSTFHRKLRSC